jgi:hypothetical protein
VKIVLYVSIYMAWCKGTIFLLIPGKLNEELRLSVTVNSSLLMIHVW